MKKTLSWMLLGLSFGLLGCGSGQGGNSPLGSALVETANAAVLLRHPGLVGVPPTVVRLRVIGTDDQEQLTYGPVVLNMAEVIHLERVATATRRLLIEYLDDTRIVGVHQARLQAGHGTTAVLVNPAIELLVRETTLDRTIETDDSGTYRRLKFGAPWQTVVRQELASAQSGREDRRTPLLSIAHLSDVHLADSESPLRLEFLRHKQGFKLPLNFFQGAWRPHETLVTHVAESMVQKMNRIGRGPFTGRPYDFAISTGDNSDNRHQNELERFVTILDGGPITPSSGNPDLYEGVQDSVNFDSQYWHPEPGAADQYKTVFGFPDYPGLLQAAVAPFLAQGLQTPWYSAYGNHDNLLQGNFRDKASLDPTGALESIAVGGRKITQLPLTYALLELVVAGSGVDLFLAEFIDPIGLAGSWQNFVSNWNSLTTPSRSVTPDPKRHIVSRQEFAQAHLNSPAVPGPLGHGFTAENVQNDTLYYTFEPAPGFLGITLDTVNPGGEADGSLDPRQVAWLEQRLQEVHSRYFDLTGKEVRTGRSDKLVILFSHHHLATLTNVLPDPDRPDDVRILGGVFESLLHRYPNVVLWMNGHSHICRNFHHPDPIGRTGGFWEVNTPSHIDFPQQSRIVEMVNNQDGTLSIFATLVDHLAPPTTGPVSADVLRLASISRELCANDPQIDRAVQLGTPSDRNVELLIKAPFELTR